jgi:hypothetical protein
MSTVKQAIVFTELASSVPGEGLEGLTRLLAERLGLYPQWSGRGADRGRDLLLDQRISFPLNVAIRWLVSCKDFADAKRSVGESDLPPQFEAKMIQHQAQGFLLVTTTTASTGAKELLDGLSSAGRCFTDVWDGIRLRELLLKPSNEDLLKQFLPASFQRIRDIEGACLDGIERVVEQFAHVTNPPSRILLIPGIPEPLPRSEVAHVEDLLASKRSVLLVGEPGTGKSGIAYALCTPRSNPVLPVLFLDVRKYSDIRHFNDLPDRIGLQDQIVTSINRVAQRTGCRLILDQIDSASGEVSGQAFVELALECSRIPGVEVIVLSRRRESYEQKLLEQLIEGGFAELECNELSDGAACGALRRIGIETPSAELADLSRNLLNLSLIARMRKQQPAYDFSSVLDETVLWEGYVEVLHTSERHTARGERFGEEVVAEATRCAREGLLAEDRTFLVKMPKTSQQRCLESWQIIVQEEGYNYRFLHEKLQDFLYALDAVKAGQMPEDVVNDIGQFRTRTVLPWMSKLYPHHRPGRRAEFLRKALNG